ncbi:ATP-dependent DNA helicase [Polyangium sorediatum]|uniref:DNA 5'-3' helicase n=1 Tax=Polyangium sorediatum TaxID=889274 RepID=A0ABT6P252_9BACT|nr:ATP-dependent DNA helicase [Polyangium sorediatum]MDI1434674.1 ATP-dependent DNA helicase [Polyangium sorediatum]
MSDDDDDVEADEGQEEPAREGRSRRLLGPSGPLARAFEGYEDREGQLAMADAVERALDEDRVLLCEAGTGTGKTLAYLVPAILSGRKVVISTATKALEEQIFAKDLPLVAEYLGLRVSAALVKGLGNYLCLRRLDELRTSPEANHDAGVMRSLPVVEAWARETEVGDLSELVTLAESDPIRREVCSSSETRIGSACPFFEKCFVTRMKREAEEARVLVVNHHLFFADLSLKLGRGNVPGAGALPPYDAVIFDEAHELEDIATEFFGTRISGSRVDSMLRDADRAFIASGLADRILGRGEGTAIVAIVREAADRFFAAVARVAGEAAREGRVELKREVWAGELVDAYHHFDEALEALAGYASAHAITEAVALVGTRAETLRADAAKIVDGKSNQVTWVEVRARSVSVGASAVDVGWLFREGVFERIGGVVLTSATMTAKAGDFRFLRTRLGLDERVTVPVDELVVPSPFDYASRALLYTPRDLPEASEPAFLAASADRIVELVDIVGGGAFVLCTSNRSMVALGRALAGRVPGPLMVQGQAPKRMLLSKFRAAHHAVLVATMSFWEGVDVPGDALRLVVIDKIPFAVPTDPVVVARSQAIEQAGHSPFATYTVPQAAITLKQGFGRLIRTRQDRGIVAILDRRVRTRGYGALLLDGLPPAARTERIDEVKAFWARILAEDSA